MAKETLTKLQQDRAILSARVEALSSLIEVGIIINSTFHLDEVMQLVMKKAQQVMQAEASSILLINREKKVFECPVALGDAGEKFKTIEIPLDRGIAGWVASHQQAQIIPDAYQDDR
ncbi:MAG: GAF domain-containing protein, partial [Calditrichaeota bacterium]|nr:GAF domain-containing protein [Calditrichota bacterium]